MRPLIWLAIYSAVIISVLFSAQVQVVNDALSLGVPILLFILSCYVLLYPIRSSRDPARDSPIHINRETAERPTRSGGPRSVYLDTIKVFLTCCVVLHHSIGAFSGSGLGVSVGVYHSTFQAFAVPVLWLQQSYFMCFFFFISALFVPASLARKGTRAFLADKAKRLVLPFIVMFFVLYPLFIGGLGDHPSGS